LILGSDEAKVSNRARGVTFESTVYQVVLFGKTYSLHDTVGLGEHSSGTVDSAKAVGNLYRLVTDLSSSGGVNLLVFVIKCGRLTDAIHKNYTLFYRAFCDSKVPILIVVTGCEAVKLPPMDTWWIENEPWFTQAGMSFNGHACVCAFKGTKVGGYRNRDLVEESSKVVKQRVVQRCAPNGWKMVSLQSGSLKPQNLPKHFQYSHRLIGLKRLSDPLLTCFGHHKYHLSIPTFTIAL
jgi:hypothetical protein